MKTAGFMAQEIYSLQMARLAAVLAIAMLLVACQTTDRSSKNNFSAEFKSIRENNLACAERVSKDPAIQIIRTRTPLQPKDYPGQKMKAIRDLMTDREIVAMNRYQELSSTCRDNLVKASGNIDPRYTTVLMAGYAEQDKLVEALKKRQHTWGAYNEKYEKLKIDVNEKISAIDNDLTN